MIKEHTTTGHPQTPAVQALWQSNLYCFVALSPDGKITNITGADHIFNKLPNAQNTLSHISNLIPGFDPSLDHPSHESEHHLKDNSGKDFYLSIETIPAEHDQKLLILRDITPRKEAEMRLFHAQKMEAIGHITSGITHNFNNLLTIILGALRAIKKETDDMILSDALNKHIETLNTASNRAAYQVSRLMMFARPDECQKKPVNLADFITDMGELIAMSVHNNVHLSNLIPQSLWPVMIDKAQFETIILNMSVNASDAMPDEGLLVMSANNVVLDENYRFLSPDVQEGRYVCLSIADTGHGMDAETLEHIFEPFFTTKEPGKGTGLGLSMVYGTIHKMGGYIHAYSEPSHGTTFKIYLPAAQENAMQDAAPATPPKPLMGKTVLILDDQPLMQDISARSFERLGMHCYKAKTALEAKLLLERHNQTIDCAFIDLFLSDENKGIDIAQLIEKNYPHIKCLYTSGHIRETLEEEFAPPQDAPLLIKPFSQEDLLTAITGVMAPED